MPYDVRSPCALRTVSIGSLIEIHIRPSLPATPTMAPSKANLDAPDNLIVQMTSSKATKGRRITWQNSDSIFLYFLKEFILGEQLKFHNKIDTKIQKFSIYLLSPPMFRLPIIQSSTSQHHSPEWYLF